LQAEAELYKDILLVNIIESYYNLVFKHIIGNSNLSLYKDILLVNIIESYYNLVFKHVIGNSNLSLYEQKKNIKRLNEILKLLKKISFVPFKSKYKTIYSNFLISGKINLIWFLGLTWAVLNCDSQEIMKMDDDISVNFPALLNVARQNIPLNQLVWMMGLLQVKTSLFENFL